MTPITAALILFCGGYALAASDDYIMVEVEPEYYDRTIVKRQAQYSQEQQQQGLQYAQQGGQYVQQPSADQITPEYYAYLQQIQAQQIQAQQIQAQQLQAQQSPSIEQVLSSRAPQRFQQQIPPRPPAVPEEVRRLQESFVQSPLREQEREDQTNQQLLSLGINPSLVRRQRLRESAERLAIQQAEENAARKAIQAAEQQYQQLYQHPQQFQQQLVQVPQEIPVQQQAESAQQTPERVSYSQISFGSTKLPQQSLIPGRTQQIVYTQPAQLQQQQQSQIAYREQTPQEQQQVVYQPQLVYRQQQERPVRPQQFVYTQQPVRAEPQLVYAQQAERTQYKPQRAQAVTYQPQIQYVQRQPQAEVTQKQTPEQYLIETTKQAQPQQQVVTIPRRQQFSYRPQANYQDLQAAITAQQQNSHLARQQVEASTTPSPRSSIYVTTARTPVQKGYTTIPEYRIPKQDNMRPLTQSELNALINAGFSVTPARTEQDYSPQYFRGLAKRQNTRPRIGRVSLSPEERKALAKNGIRNLYRVETAESQDSPVTYVLALENQKRNTEKSTSS